MTAIHTVLALLERIQLCQYNLSRSLHLKIKSALNSSMWSKLKVSDYTKQTPYVAVALTSMQRCLNVVTIMQISIIWTDVKPFFIIEKLIPW